MTEADQAAASRPSWTFIVLIVLTAAAATVTVGGLLAQVHPLLEALTNVRLQLMIVAVPLALAAAARRHWNLTAIALVVLMVNAFSALPYLIPGGADPQPESKGDVVRVMQYNVWFENLDLDAIAQHIIGADADVVVLHELTSPQWTGLEPQLRDDYGFALGLPVDGEDGQLGGGMAVLTRTSATRRLPVAPEVSPDDRPLLAVATEAPNGDELLVLGLHPHASRHVKRKVDLREDQLAGVVELAAAWDGPVAIVTDMNVTPTSPVYGELLDDLGWRDPHRLVGWKSSWPTWGGWLGLPIDHVLVSNDVALHGYSIGDGAGSDHRSVTAEISLR